MASRIAKSPRRIQDDSQVFFQKVFGWMFLGLLVSAAASFLVVTNDSLILLIFGNRMVFYGLIIAELGMVFFLAFLIKRISSQVAIVLFLLYSLSTGLTLSVIFFVFDLSSIVIIFFVAAAMFGIMSVYGYFTKTDLTTIGQFLIMALIGLVISALINMFLKNSTFDYIISFAGVLIFTGLTAYDVQRIKKMSEEASDSDENTTKIAIIGALNLYLDFINLFLSLLELFGRRK